MLYTKLCWDKFSPLEEEVLSWELSRPLLASPGASFELPGLGCWNPILLPLLLPASPTLPGTLVNKYLYIVFSWSQQQIPLVCWLSFLLPLFPSQGYWKFLFAHHAVYASLKSDSLAYLFRLLTSCCSCANLASCRTQSSPTGLGVAYRTNTFCSRIFSNLRKGPLFPLPPELG